MTHLLEANGLTKSFKTRRRGRKQLVAAVRGVSFTVNRGRTLGIVGESGSGKSTTARLLLRLIDADAGSVTLDGSDVFTASKREMRQIQRRMPMVFQDPYSSLDPTWLVSDTVTEAAALETPMSSKQRFEMASELLEMVGLAGSFATRYPYELSGGQRQRVALARALACRPEVIVFDEAVAALDVSTRASVISLLQDLQQESGAGYIFISHDLTLVEAISDDVAVMYLGRIVERGPTRELYNSPAHPYTRALIDAVPVPDPVVQRQRERRPVAGEIPSALNIPRGCAFNARCPLATEVCRTDEPPERQVGPSHMSACHHAVDGGVELLPIDRPTPDPLQKGLTQ